MGSSGGNNKIRFLASLLGHRPQKRVLIINVFMDDRRVYLPNSFKVPQTMAPVYLAGAFSRTGCRVRIYNEHRSGPLKDKSLLAWPDMLVLTGVITGFDRMLHMVAYAKTLNPKVITVAGGPAIRALPKYSREFFDYACQGDVEQMQEVIADAWGREWADPEMTPRYDLLPRFHPVDYLETSRNCNFRCGFCSLTAERNEYQKYSLKNMEKQLRAMKPGRHLCFIDNNFYGDDREFFLARVDLLQSFYKRGHFKSWSALVTHDFFLDFENLDRARESGCESLFSGVESFDRAELESYQKRQNLLLPQMAAIHRCLQSGIVFHYGLMFDPSRRSVRELRSEIDLFLSAPGITLPSFISLTIPFLGTPYFEECVRENRLLPRLKLRDLDGFTQTMKPVDPPEAVASLVRDLLSFRRYRRKVLRKAWEVWKTHRGNLSVFQRLQTLVNVFNLCAPHWINSPGRFPRMPAGRTYISTTEPLDPVYRPMFPVHSRYRDYFKPTLVTDDGGRLTEALLNDYQPDGSRLKEKDPPPLLSAIGFLAPHRVETPTRHTEKDQKSFVFIGRLLTPSGKNMKRGKRRILTLRIS